jgi:hypothetical protein
MHADVARRLLLCVTAAASLILTANVEADARTVKSQLAELSQIPRVRPEFPVPNEPNMLFYVERSVNSNTVIYAANLDSHGRIDAKEPINAYWRWYNVDGHKKPLILIERMLAYGVKSVTHNGPRGAVTFKIAAVPERTIVVDLDSRGQPEALVQLGGRWAKLVYIYLEVDDSGLWPKVPSLDIFGIDKLTGQPLREHVFSHS